MGGLTGLLRGFSAEFPAGRDAEPKNSDPSRHTTSPLARPAMPKMVEHNFTYPLGFIYRREISGTAWTTTTCM
jgi:hypothetical protein